MRQDEKVVRVREQGQVAICGGVGIYGLVRRSVRCSGGGLGGRVSNDIPLCSQPDIRTSESLSELTIFLGKVDEPGDVVRVRASGPVGRRSGRQREDT